MQHNKQLKKQKEDIKGKKNSQYSFSVISEINILNPVGKTEYLTFTSDDLVYPGNLQRIRSTDFQFILRKISKDLIFLLHFKYQDFWAELKSSENLRHCLSSCLQMFPRRNLVEYAKKIEQIKQQPSRQLEQILGSQAFKIFSIAMKSVLSIYHRIACQSNKAQKQTIYQYWLIDIPKMLNLISIYKESNEKILREIISSIFNNIPSFKEDILDFVHVINETVLDSLFYDLSFEFKKQVIQKSKNFNNPLYSFTHNLIKSFFKIFDAFRTVSDYVKYFPEKYVLQLLSTHDFLLNMIEAYFIFLDNIGGGWEYSEDFQQKFSPVIEMIRQTMLSFFIHCFDSLDKKLSNYESEELWGKCLSIYYSICRQFYYRKQSPREKRWESLILVMIKQTPHRLFFRYEQSFGKKLSKEELKIIKGCNKFEIIAKQNLRKSFDEQEIIELKLSKIKSYEQWRAFQSFQQLYQLSEIGQNEFELGESLQSDSIAQILTKQLNVEQNKDIAAIFKNLERKAKMKLLKFPYFPSPEYNDEPVEHEGAQEKQYFPTKIEEQQLDDDEKFIENEYEVQRRLRQERQKQNNRKKVLAKIADQNAKDKKNENGLKAEFYDKYNRNNQDQVPKRSNQKQGNKDSAAAGFKKKKENYVCTDQLSISYIQETEAIFQKRQIKRDLNTFKVKEYNDTQKANKNVRLKKEEEQPSNLSLQLISYNYGEEGQKNSKENILQNFLDQVYQSELSICYIDDDPNSSISSKASRIQNIKDTQGSIIKIKGERKPKERNEIDSFSISQNQSKNSHNQNGGFKKNKKIDQKSNFHSKDSENFIRSNQSHVLQQSMSLSYAYQEQKSKNAQMSKKYVQKGRSAVDSSVSLSNIDLSLCSVVEEKGSEKIENEKSIGKRGGYKQKGNNGDQNKEDGRNSHKEREKKKKKAVYKEKSGDSLQNVFQTKNISKVGVQSQNNCHQTKKKTQRQNRQLSYYKNQQW